MKTVPEMGIEKESERKEKKSYCSIECCIIFQK